MYFPHTPTHPYIFKNAYLCYLSCPSTCYHTLHMPLPCLPFALCPSFYFALYACLTFLHLPCAFTHTLFLPLHTPLPFACLYTHPFTHTCFTPFTHPTCPIDMPHHTTRACTYFLLYPQEDRDSWFPTTAPCPPSFPCLCVPCAQVVTSDSQIYGLPAPSCLFMPAPAHCLTPSSLLPPPLPLPHPPLLVCPSHLPCPTIPPCL